LPNTFRFPLPKKWAGGATVGPHSAVEGNAVVDEFIPDDEVNTVMIGSGRCLYVWGVTKYRDILGKTRTVTFAQQLLFVGPREKIVVKGFYLGKHNKSN
jgi:hypothetical protein